MYVTHLVAGKEELSPYVTTKCMTNSYTSLNGNSPQKLYAAKPSSANATEDQRGRYVRGVVVWIQEVTVLLQVELYPRGTERTSDDRIKSVMLVLQNQ